MGELMTTTGAELRTQPQSMADLLQRFIEYVDVRETTMKSYAVCLRSFGEWLQGNHVTQPQRADILAYKEYLATPHRRRARYDRPNSRPGSVITLAAGTQQRYLRAVKLFFAWTAQEGLYPNVADRVKGAKCKADNTHRDPLQREDAMRVLEAIDRSTTAGKRDYAVILLAITCGLRVIELVRANYGNLETLAGEHVLYIQGKGHDEADTYKKLTPEVYAALTDYLKTRGTLDPSAPLFASESHRNMGGRITEPSMCRIIKNCLKAAGFDSHRISAHSLRHTSVTMLLESGATIQEAQQHARHASPETTGIYAHNLQQQKEHNEQRIYDFLFGVEHDAANEAEELLKSMSADKQAQALQLLKAIAA